MYRTFSSSGYDCLRNVGNFHEACIGELKFKVKYIFCCNELCARCTCDGYLWIIFS